ncbi:hypothetical protein DEFDS_P046 (plasmid) [Deferribacter desulfuricans SSM1]|uniref:Uncharacterized protein n=1 Tax=Deferribacter desulfuricans (strain DSM 14783 / JCM 11476 / NBRC 101012 / SSM1) TaxID=639282 RepID=D3PEM8_DEFDS|nr:hypothetical protein [Deferribacter desulfuricans]BAI81670.1 hypothetical protein DEFDS_P046 [Deferribacter desulfuricans SSM1]
MLLKGNLVNFYKKLPENGIFCMLTPKYYEPKNFGYNYEHPVLIDRHYVSLVEYVQLLNPDIKMKDFICNSLKNNSSKVTYVIDKLVLFPNRPAVCDKSSLLKKYKKNNRYKERLLFPGYKSKANMDIIIDSFGQLFNFCRNNKIEHVCLPIPALYSLYELGFNELKDFFIDANLIFLENNIKLYYIFDPEIMKCTKIESKAFNEYAEVMNTQINKFVIKNKSVQINDYNLQLAI